MRLRTASSLLFVALSYASVSRAENQWLNPEQVGEWTVALEAESTGTDSARLVFNPIGFLVGLSGHFLLNDSEPATVAGWLDEHREALGVQVGENFDCGSTEPFVEPFSPDGETVETAQFGIIYNCAVTIDELASAHREIRVIVDARDESVLRGLVNTYYPTINGYVTADLSFSEEDAWTAVENEFAIADRRAALRQWSSVDWIDARLPGEKEYLWVLSAEIDGDGVRSFVVSPSTGSVWATDSMSWFGEKHQEHRGFAETGAVYWDSAMPTTGCIAPSSTCINPALTDSLALRDTFPLVLESWVNLSSQTGDSFDWPWTASQKSPLRSASSAGGGKIRAIVAHGTQTVNGDCGAQPTPCSRYPTIWFGPGYVGPDLQGHELGHFFLDDLKTGISRGQDRPSAVLSEVFADFVGLTTEDFMFRIAQPDPLIGTRTDFKVTSGAATINWTTASTNCNSSPLTKRVAVGGALYRGWNSYRAYYPAAYRDAVFSVWRRTTFNALHLTTDVAPTSLDLYAAVTALTTPPQFIINNRPPPSNYLQSQLAGLATACW